MTAIVNQIPPQGDPGAGSLTGWELAAELAEVAEELAELALAAGHDPRANRGRLGRLARRNRELVESFLADMEVSMAFSTPGETEDPS